MVEAPLAEALHAVHEGQHENDDRANLHELLPVLHVNEKGAILQKEKAARALEEVDVVLDFLVGLDFLVSVEGAEIWLFEAEARCLKEGLDIHTGSINRTLLKF